MKPRVSLSFGFLLASSAFIGCSFINDFPDVIDLGVGGSGGGGGGVCAPSTLPQPELVWYATKDGTGIDGDYTEFSGLVRRGTSVLAWGTNSNGLIDFPGLPTGTSNRAFLVDLPDGGGAKTMLGTLVSCDVIDGAGFGTGRMALAGTEPLVTGAMTSGPGQTSASYGFGRGFDDGCTVSIAEPTMASGSVAPFSAYNGRLTSAAFLNEAVPDAKGYSIDIATNGTRYASIGVGIGSVSGIPTNWIDYYLLTSTIAGSDPPTLLPYTIEDPPFDSGNPQVYGGVAVDEASNVWMTGKSCGGTNPDCFGKGTAFIDSLPLTGPINNVPVATSIQAFGSVIRAGAGAVVVGGGYRGELTIGGANFPPSPDNVDAFLVALDPTNRSVRWTYPSSPITGYDRTGFDAVVDVAIVPDASCGGFVYVAGCYNVAGLPTVDCRTYEPETGTFVVKLRLDTGEEVWAGNFNAMASENPEVLPPRLIPTAAAADASGFWVAFHFTGQLDFSSNSFSRDSVIYKFAP